MARFREFWYPDLMSREIRETWLERGGTTLGERLSEKVKTVVKEHRPRSLAADKKTKVHDILEGIRA
jgi:trimethylamine:corrinoid methyltransferase-like protein